MAKKAIAKVFRWGKIAEIHEFMMPSPGEKDYTRASKKYASFKNRQNRDLYSPVKTAIRVAVRYEDEEDLEIIFPEPDIKPASHPTIWVFFKELGYDPKTDRWVTPENMRSMK